jgi:hypothetical protein
MTGVGRTKKARHGQHREAGFRKPALQQQEKAREETARKPREELAT